MRWDRRDEVPAVLTGLVIAVAVLQKLSCRRGDSRGEARTALGSKSPPCLSAWTTCELTTTRAERGPNKYTYHCSFYVMFW